MLAPFFKMKVEIEMSVVKTVEIQGRKIKFEFNKYAKQTNGSVMVSNGGTQVLVTVCAAEKVKEGQDFFPLTVDYVEKMYAAGRIPGGFFKREGRLTERETLLSRVIDRPLRPSFPEEYLCDTFITATVVSYEKGRSPAPLAMLGASAALMISDIPFNGPVAGLRIGMDGDGKFIVDPSELEEGRLDLTVAANPKALLMVEAGADFLTEAQMVEALEFAHLQMQPFFDMQIEIQKEIGKPKRKLEPVETHSDLYKGLKQKYQKDVAQAFLAGSKSDRQEALSLLKQKIVTEMNPEKDAALDERLSNLFGRLKGDTMRENILEKGNRIDGRDLVTIRPITCEVGPLVSPHGSALFTRGETQSLGTATLGSGDDVLRQDSILAVDGRKRFMLHYNFPPFSVGEARPNRGAGRREIGHGFLAERAIQRIIPDANEFGYTIRLVSEILESNGSSSMASVCSGTMALLDAGVPIKEPVAGIAMGLVYESPQKYAILSDILGDEDHLGDMDFKVCGSARGITALQMDIKLDSGLPAEVLSKALEQARKGRLHILEKMNAAISTPGDLKENAPRIFQIKIKADKIRDIIGPGGKNIKRITAETGCKIDIDDSGIISLMSPDSISAEAAKKMIRDYTSEPEVGAIYLGTIRKVMDFGCFVEIKPGCDGLCHISQLEERRVDDIFAHYKEGEEMMVKVLEIDSTGRIKLSRKDAIDRKPT